MHLTPLRVLAVTLAGTATLALGAANPASARVPDADTALVASDVEQEVEQEVVPGDRHRSHQSVEQERVEQERVEQEFEQECFQPGTDLATSARGGQAIDHREISAAEQAAVEARTDRILARQAGQGRGTAAAAGSIPVYVHVMAGSSGAGDVTDAQIADQVAVLNATYGGAESSAAADTGFAFTLAGTDRFYNNTWHRDGASTTYRSRTRQGGADALNIWLVDFDYLGVATFPWDYSRSPGVDGIRVQYSSLPGGDATNYDQGKTATHEAGHWLGLYHTFQGGCTSTNDQVGDTPAQSSPTNGCPAGADTCSLPGLDPIHNYMDYSFDGCYDQFTGGQSSRMSQMWSAYRA